MATNLVKVIATQHQHVFILLNKIKDMEKQLTETLLNKEDWHKFIEKHVDTNTLKYVTSDLPCAWYNKDAYDYDMTYNFYRGREILGEHETIKYLTITINLYTKGENKLFYRNSVPLTVNIVTDMIDIEELNKFLNEI